MSLDAKSCHVLILADESADWTVAGLRQLDRFALSLNEFAERNGNQSITICALWKPGFEQSRSRLPQDERLARIRFTADLAGEPFDLALSTRLFLYRNAVPQLIEAWSAPSGLASTHSEEELWNIYSQHLETVPRTLDRTWEYITLMEQIDEIERRFLRGSGKSQDGVVSRYLNRPISRAVTRIVLRFPITPNLWTLAIFPIPIAAALILLHGTYWSFLLGLILFHAFSVLDGCDGEIARAKFLESKRGRQLDDLCDVLSNILLVVGLGFGLSRQMQLAGYAGWFYALEGCLAAALIGVNELLLATRRPIKEMPESVSLGGALYPRHRQLVEHSGLLFFGEKFASGLIQLTKRDVAVLFFVFLAAIGQSAWILHLLLAVTAISLALAAKAFGTRRPR